MRPLNREARIEREPVRLRDSEICLTKDEEEPTESDRDLARLFVSEPVTPRDPVMDLNRKR